MTTILLSCPALIIQKFAHFSYRKIAPTCNKYCRRSWWVLTFRRNVCFHHHSRSIIEGEIMLVKKLVNKGSYLEITKRECSQNKFLPPRGLCFFTLRCFMFRWQVSRLVWPFCN
jgi:hypothetical protein